MALLQTAKPVCGGAKREAHDVRSSSELVLVRKCWVLLLKTFRIQAEAWFGVVE